MKSHVKSFISFLKTVCIVGSLAFVIRTYFYGLYQVPTGSMETTMLVGEHFFADKLTLHFKPLKRGDIIAFNDPNFEYSSNYAMRLLQRYVWGPSNWTKRIIGIPGDHVKGVIEDGKPVVYLNGSRLEEPYLNQCPLVAVYVQDHRPPWIYRSYDESLTNDQQLFYKIYQADILRAKRMVARFGLESLKRPQTLSYNSAARCVDEFDVQVGPGQYWVMGDNRLESYDSRYWGGAGKALEGDLIHGKIVFRLFSFDTRESWLIKDFLKGPRDFIARIRWNRFFQVIH